VVPPYHRISIKVFGLKCRFDRRLAEMYNTYNERKAAQVAAFFLFRAQGRMPILKLMKLLYLAERTSYQKFGEPIIGDKLVSMDHGPVLSITYQHINGELRSEEGGWDTWVSGRENYDVSLQDPSCIRTPEQDLLELCDDDLDVLEETWSTFGHMTKWQIRDYTHDNCPEWENPRGSMIPMDLPRLFKALDFNEEQAKELEDRVAASSGLNAAYAIAKNSSDSDGCVLELDAPRAMAFN
jgi:uncharacterized phage-associated protein